MKTTEKISRALRVCVVLVVGLLVFTACGKNDLQGDITAKEHQPGYEYVYYQPMYSTSCSGNPAVCTQVLTGMLPIYYWVPDCYKITVKGTTSGSACIDKTEYDTIKIGDSYTGPDVDPKDRQEQLRTGDEQPVDK